MPLRLSFETGALAGIHIVTAAQTIRLGRDPQQNDILLTNPKVSRKHAVIERSVRGGYSIEILGTGPSKLNGDVIAAVGGRATVHVLANNDRLDFGGVEFVSAEADAKLIVVSGPTSGRELHLDGPARIGRGQDCDLVIDDAGVAEEHLVIASTPLGFRADAAAPTMFNGARGESRVLAHGDELVVGGTTLRFTVSVSDEDLEAESSMGGHASASSVKLAVSNAVGELVFIAGAAKGEKLPLGDDQIILGSRGDCTFPMSDLLVSSLHCAVSKSGDQFVATDLGSETGTYINGERIFQGTALKPGDLIAVGMHVLQARLLGGVTAAKKGNTIYTTIAPGSAQDMGPQPRFVIDGRVIKSRKITFGRAPSNDVIVEGPTVSREHCAIEWSTEGYQLRDSSSTGTYADDKRVVQLHLPPTGVIRIADTLFRIAVRGEVCTIERTDAALAQAAVDVAREHASRLAQPGHRTMFQQAAGAPAGAGGLKTMFRMDAGVLEQEIAAKKKEQRRNAPAWRPSSDLQKNRAMRGVVMVSVLAALALCGGALLFGGGRALVNHPLSAAHSSAAFAAKSETTTVCASCHSAGARVAVDRCATCHTGFTPRAKHDALDCAGCHKEHEGSSADGSLHARDACGGCHTNQHAAELAGTGAPQKLAAGPLPAKKLATAELHAAHARRTIAGQDVGIGCTSCHGTIVNGALTEAKPGLSCFRCHQGGEVAGTTGCDSCHAREHPAALTRMPAGAAGTQTTMSVPSPVGALGWALGIAFAGGTPGLALGAWFRLRRRRTDSALAQAMKAHPAEVVKRLVHSINDSKCVGCGLCVQACPASVLELVDHKSRVVNFDSCIQCKKCEHACAFDALRMHDADKPPPMIPMPSIDAFHETPVAGMFLVGQASGTPQVKNATNLGRAAVQRIVQQGFAPGSGRALGCDLDVVIVGSGPSGLSAALTCIELGLSYVVLEKEREFSWTIRNYYHKGKEVMAEPHDVALEATLPHWDTSREQLLGAWQQLVEQHRVDIRYQANVIDIKKDGQRFAVHLGDPKGAPVGQVTCGRVVIAIGTLGNPRKLGCAGDELEKVKNSLVDPDEWMNKSVLVVGGSDSAVEVVLALCQPQRGNRVWFSTRGAKLEGIKPKNRKLIEDALAAGQFKICYATTVADVTPTTVALSYKEDGRREELPNDVVFAMIGGNSPQKWLQQIGIPYADKPHSWSPPRTDLLSQKTAEGLIQIRRLR